MSGKVDTVMSMGSQWAAEQTTRMLEHSQSAMRIISRGKKYYIHRMTFLRTPFS